MQFTKTIEVFNKITASAKAEIDEHNEHHTTFTVSQKQFEWLAAVYIQEAGGWDTRYGVSVSDTEGNQYAFSYKNKMFNVPHYIPTREKYGCKYFVDFYKSK